MNAYIDIIPTGPLTVDVVPGGGVTIDLGEQAKVLLVEHRIDVADYLRAAAAAFFDAAGQLDAQRITLAAVSDQDGAA